MAQYIDIDDFKGVFTHADLSDLPNSIATELKNFRPVNGKLVKTYDFNDIDGICPIVDVDGWTVMNVFTYIQEDLVDGYVYLVIMREDASPNEFRILWFVADLAPAEGEPAKLVPFSADSFWMQVGSSQTYVNDGFALIMDTVFSDTTLPTPITHTFTTPAWQKPNDVDGGNATTVFGGVPFLEGIPYNMEEALYTDTNSSNDIITDNSLHGLAGHIGFNGRIKDFSAAGGLLGYAMELRAVKRFNDVTYCAVSIKSGSDYLSGYAGDLIMYHDGTSWTVQDMTATPFSYSIASGDIVRITNFTVWDGRFYMGVMYHEGSGGGSGYNHDFWYIDWATPANTAKVFTHNEPSSVKYGYDIGDVTTATGTYSSAEKLFVLHRYDAKPSSSEVGGLFYYLEPADITTSSANAVALPSGLGAAVYSSQCIYTETGSDFIALSYNIDSVADSAVIRPLISLTPSWDAISIGTITGTDAPTAPYTIDIISDAIGYSYGGGDYATFVMYISDASVFAAGWYVIQYDGTNWTSAARYDAGFSPMFLEEYLHDGRTGNNVILSLTGTKNALFSFDADGATASQLIVQNTDSQPYNCFDSYEKTHEHLSVINALYGIDDSSNGHPVLYKFIAIGANPSWGSWTTSMDFTYTATACVAWTMAVDGTIPELYHKNAQNPVVLNNGILRIYGGALATVGANEVKNIWLGYVDREFLFGAWAPSAGFYSEDNTPSLPTTWTPEIVGLTGVATTGALTLGGTVSYMFVPVFDGIQEELKNKAVVRTTDTDATIVLDVSLDLDKDDLSKRMTAIKVYRSSDDLVWGLVKTINFSSDSGNQDYHAGGTANIGRVLYVPNAGFIAAGVVDTDDVEIAGSGTQGIASGGVFDDYIILDADANANIWDGVWAVSNTGGTVVVTSGTNNGYAGINVVFNDSWDWGALELGGWSMYVSANPSDYNIANSYKKAILLYGDDVADFTNGATGASVTVDSITNGYRFEEGATDDTQITVHVFDNGLTEGASFPLDGAVSLKVNSDFAEVISNRMWQGRVVLDVGDENEEQSSAVTYSELNQLDVTPVSNLIKFNDREGGGITGIAELFGRPIVTMNQNISLIDSKTDPATPANWTISESVHNIGNISKHGMVSALGSIYVVYYDGIYRLTANNLAETDQTPTERLKISQDIDEVYQAVSDKTAIIGEYDQQKNEIVWNFGTEMWAYSLVRNDWREIDSATTSTIDFLTIDENADLLAYDTSDGAFKSLEVDKTNTVGTADSTWKSKRYAFSLDRKSSVRQMSVYYDSDDDFTIKVYLNDNNTATPDGTYSVSKRAGENVRHIPIKRYARNFQVEIVTEDSTNSFEINKIRLEVEE